LIKSKGVFPLPPKLGKHEDGADARSLPFGRHSHQGGIRMSRRMGSLCIVAVVGTAAATLSAQSFRVQCPTSTITHSGPTNDKEPAYTGPSYSGESGYPRSALDRRQQISGGDGYATMGDGTQTYMLSFSGPYPGWLTLLPASGH
jgi:hypothetical protein